MRFLVFIALLACSAADARPYRHHRAANLPAAIAQHRQKLVKDRENAARTDAHDKKLKEQRAKKQRVAGLPMPPYMVGLQAALAQSEPYKEDYCTLYMGQVNGVHTLNTYLAPVLYWDTATASLAAIDQELTPSPSANNPRRYLCPNAYVGSTVQEDGTVDLNYSGSHLILTPYSFGSATAQTLMSSLTDPVDITRSDVVNRLAFDGLFPNATMTVEAVGNGVKETLVLPAKPTLSGTDGILENYVLKWAVVQNEIAVPENLPSGSIKVGDLYIQAPVATDAAGSESYGVATFDPDTNWISYSISGVWLNAAVYPVTIDPTTTAPTTFGVCTRKASSGSNIWGTFAYMIDLPSIGDGMQYLSSTFKLTKTSGTGTSSLSWTYYSSAWTGLTETSTASDINTNILTPGGSYSSSQTIATGNANGTVYTWSDTSCAVPAQSVATAYSSNYNPGNWSFALRNTTETDGYFLRPMTNTVNTLSVTDSSNYVVVGWTSNATASNRPVFTVTYTEPNMVYYMQMHNQ